MIYHGRASISDLLGDFVAFRRLLPMDDRLRGDVRREQIAPRKGTEVHARIVAGILRTAWHLVHGLGEPTQLFYIGDTMGSDVRTFRRLCEITGWSGQGLIVEQLDAPFEIRCDGLSDRSKLFHSNDWQAAAPARLAAEDILTPGKDSARTVAIVDIDKTLIGARGRNSAAIDSARVRAVCDVAASILGDEADRTLLEERTRALDHPDWHALTSDNQDVVAYLALLTSSKVIPWHELSAWKHSNGGGFAAFLEDVDTRVRSDSVLAPLHEEIRENVECGEPTVFPAFRRFEYHATRAAVSSLPDSTEPEEMVRREITMTGEIWQTIRGWREKGVVVLGLSDKPDEACLPSEMDASAGDLPLHRMALHVVSDGGRS